VISVSLIISRTLASKMVSEAWEGRGRENAKMKKIKNAKIEERVNFVNLVII